MRGIPLVRSAQMHPLIDFLEDLGARTERGLERCKLPLGVRESPELLVSARAEHAFVTEMARREGIGDFGWRAASAQHRHLTGRMMTGLRHAPSLLHAIRTACALATNESSHLRIWLEEGGESVFLCHRGAYGVGFPVRRCGP